MRRSILSCLLLGIALVTSSHGQTIEQQQCDGSPGHSAVIQPDAQAFIVGYFAMNGPSPGSKSGCDVISDSEMQGYEAIRWAIDRLNKKGTMLNGEFLTDSYVPGITIGMKVRDYCSSAQGDLGLNELFPEFSASARECSKNQDALMLGLMGMSDSDATLAVAKQAEQLNLPLVSFQATAPVLSDAEMFPNFMRTIPPDGPLTYTIVQLAKNLDWQYVVIVFTENTYGNGAYREIRPQLAEAGICLTTAIGVDPYDTSNATISGVLKQVKETETVGVIYLGNRRIVDALLQTGETYLGAGSLQWIVTDSVSISSTFPGQKYPRGLLSVVPANRKIIEFEDHWARIDVNNPSVENPWYKQMYMAKNKCRLPGQVSQFTNDCVLKSEAQRRDEFVQDQFVEPAVYAVFTYAKALKNAHLALCGGIGGMCQSLKELKTMDFYNTYMRTLDFTFTKEERVESLASYSLDPYNDPAKVKYIGNDLNNPSFQIFNFNDYDLQTIYQFKSIGTYINGLLEIITNRLRFYDMTRDNVLNNIPSSQCPTSPCSPCLGALVGDKYVYIPGDVVIHAIFSLHEPGDSPFTCGDFYNGPDQGIQFLQAFIYAVEYFNNVLSGSSGRLRGVKLGALAFDDCYHHVRSNQFITEVQRHGRQIRDRNGENLLDPRHIEAYIGGQGHESLAVSMADLMNTVKKPMLGLTYTAMLDDTEEYPYFIRAQYNIEYVANAIVNVAKRNGWKYLQSVYKMDTFGTERNDFLRRVAAEHGICMVASYDISANSGENVVRQLQSRSDVQPVVTLLGYDDFRKFLHGMRLRNATDLQLITISGSSAKYIQGYEDVVEGMISVELWQPSLNGLREHLRQINVRTYETNPWMQEWVENFYGCKLSPTASQTACPDLSMFSDIDNFELNPKVLTAMYSVVAIAYGLDQTLEYYCGNDNGICGDFMNARDKSDVLMSNILASLYVEEGNPYQFIDRMGNIPFTYYNFDPFYNRLTEVGYYKPMEDFLYLEDYKLSRGRASSEVRSMCPGVCMECLYLFRYQKIMYVPGDLLIPGIFDVHEKGETPYRCSNFRLANGFQYTEAFRFALDKINSGDSPVKLNGVQLGGLGFDGCTDPIRASALVTGIYSGAIPRAQTDLAQVDFNLEELVGWLSYDSASTINVASILQRFGVPSVTPGATSPILDDKSKFTTFFRTIPSDSLIAEAMAKLSSKLGFNYIITLNAPEDGSREAVTLFRKYAQEMGICIGASYEFETDGNIQQIMGYILDSSTKVVAVFSNPDENIDNLLMEKEKSNAANDLIFITNQPWTVPVSKRLNSPTSTISFMADGNFDLFEFRSYLGLQIPSMNHPNPWLREFYETFYKCNLAGTYRYNESCLDPAAKKLDAARILPDVRTIPTINAVYALAQGIHLTLQQKCGMNYSGVCASFVSDDDTLAVVMQQMDALQFNDITQMVFKFIEREIDRKIIFKRFLSNRVEQAEGDFKDGQLTLIREETMTDLYALVPSNCVGQCLQCELTSMGEEEFQYINGDIDIGALFDIHLPGGTPYTCGKINGIHGFQLMEAFNWALEYVNDKRGIFLRRLTGVKLGSLVFDVCSSPVRAGNLIANFHARNFQISTANYRIDPSRIALYIGPMTSEASVRVADILNEIGIPQISYGASSLQLRNQRRYRYFLRTVPADDMQARALIAFLKKYEIDNIQLISQFSSVGEWGRHEFVRLAILNQICISAERVIGQEGPISETEANDAINSLRVMGNASVVVIIMDDPYPVLAAANKDDDIVDHFSFIATDKWGFGLSGFANLKELDNLIARHKVVTLDVETADIPELDDYLEYKTPENYFKNPWFKEYYEYIHNCSLSGPTTQYPIPCHEFTMGYSRAEFYIQDPYALYVINAVFSTALGIDAALVEWCGGDSGRYDGFCQILRDNGEVREIFLDHIKQVNFEDWTHQPFYYNEQGESNRGFHLYEPQNSGLSLHEMTEPDNYWEDIGHFNYSDNLKMDATYRPNMESRCEMAGENYCRCEFAQYQPSRYLKKPSEQDLNIVYVSDIHHTHPDNNLVCGNIDTGTNMQNLFAFLFAIEKINKNADFQFSGSLKLGGVALDTCSRPSRIGQDVYSLLSGEPICGETDGQQVVPPASVMAYMVRNSANSIALSSMLSPLKITSMSMSATSVELNDKIQHRYFLRTVPPDNVQALVVAEILARFAWDYVSVVYSDNSYGRSAVDTLLRSINPSAPRFCFGQAISMSENSDLAEAKSIIDRLNQKIGARVVVTFVSGNQVTQLLQATSDKGLKNRFLWVGSDTWANNEALTKDLEEPALGAITIQIRSEYSQEFRDFVKTITFTDRKGIPNDWFEEMYQTVHQCRILSSPVKKTFTRICTEDEKFTDGMIPNDPTVLHTIISVYEIAYGLNNVAACRQGSLTIASCIALQKDRKQLIYDSILDAQHDVLPDDLGNKSFNFKFTADGYGDVSYNIFNFRNNLGTGSFEYKLIGSSTGDSLDLNPRDYQGYSYADRALPRSRCPIGSTCQCVDADGNAYAFSRDTDGYIITEDGKYIDQVTGQLVTIEDEPGTSQRFQDIWALIVVTLAALGAFAALCLFVYLLVVYPVRGGTTILGYMLSFGIILQYVLVFAFIVHATQEICALRRFCLGFVYAICYSALFVKLVDCWRTRTKEDIYMVKYNKIGNPWGLFFSAVLIVLVQVMINAEWLILESPGVTKVIYNNMLWPRCVPDDFYDEGLILSNLFVMFVIFISVLIGLAAFGNDKNHWDSRWLLGCVVLTIPAWMVWCLVAALGEYKMRDAAVAIGLLYNATVMLVCGPCRKLYLLNKYQATVQEEERKSQLALSSRDYNSMYSRQYDNAPRLHDGDSVQGSPLVGEDDVFMYHPKS